MISLPEMELAAYSMHYYTPLSNFVNLGTSSRAAIGIVDEVPTRCDPYSTFSKPDPTFGNRDWHQNMASS
jgi:hypothetical protein